MSANVRPKWLRRDHRLLIGVLSGALVGGVVLCLLAYAIAYTAGLDV